MTIDEFKARVAERRDRISRTPGPDAADDQTIPEVAGDVLSLIRPRNAPPTAIDPSFWLTIIQILAPLILEWINRRFPRPTPAPAPVPAPVDSPVKG